MEKRANKQVKLKAVYSANNKARVEIRPEFIYQESGNKYKGEWLIGEDNVRHGKGT